jgi:hypothetical protein
MLRSYKGQTVLEYLIIATIIMAGIVFGGPFLAHSVSGHFRLLDDSAVDAVSEDIRQVPVPDLPAPSCNCTDWTKPLDCGNNDPCTPSQRLYMRSCTPANCKVQQECRDEVDCCKNPIKIKCGSIVPITGACSGRPAAPQATDSYGATFNVFPPGYLGVCPESAPGSPNCLVGERLYSINCGSGGSGVATYYGCLDVRGQGTGHDCAPACWDPADPDGLPLSNSAGEQAQPCDGDETSSVRMPDELKTRLDRTDVPWRAVTKRPNFPTIDMYEAYQVIITYFDPAVANQPLCSPNDGTASCHRCDPGRLCEYKCPTGLYPMSASVPGIGTVANATCRPCRNGVSELAFYKYASNATVSTITYASPPVSKPTTFNVMLDYSRNWAVAGLDVYGGNITAMYPTGGVTNDRYDCMTTPSSSTQCCWIIAGHNCGTDGDNYRISISVPTASASVWANFNHMNSGEYNSGSGFQVWGMSVAIALLRDHSGTSQAHISFQNPDYMICTENTLGIILTASNTTAAVYDSDASGVKGAYLAYADNTSTHTFYVPRQTSGTSYLYIECPGGCTLSSSTVCFAVNGGAACGSPGPGFFFGSQHIKLTYPAS